MFAVRGIGLLRKPISLPRVLYYFLASLVADVSRQKTNSDKIPAVRDRSRWIVSKFIQNGASSMRKVSVYRE